MRGDDDALVCLYFWRNRTAPKGQESLDGILQAFGSRKHVRLEFRVARITDLETGVAVRKGRRRRVIGAPPDLDLCITELRRRLRLVETLQRAVMALVEAPGIVHRNPHTVHFLEHDPERLDGALEHGGECYVKGKALLLQKTARGPRFGHALLGQADIGPSAEAVFEIPDGFTVTQQDELVH